MKTQTADRNWSRDELIVAFNLYCKTPFTRINAGNRAIRELASIIHRSPSAVALKLANFARLDPALRERNISGMSHGSKAEAEIWSEFSQDWEGLAYQSESILAGYKSDSVEDSTGIAQEGLPTEGRERDALVRTRVNQRFFRLSVLASYDNRCCVTGISVSELLVASHIIPWAVAEEHRMNPRNGLCLNALHDMAFDKGLITITTDYRFRMATVLKKRSPETESFFWPYEDKAITLPQRFPPAIESIQYHNEHVFIDGCV